MLLLWVLTLTRVTLLGRLERVPVFLCPSKGESAAFGFSGTARCPWTSVSFSSSSSMVPGRRKSFCGSSMPLGVRFTRENQSPSGTSSWYSSPRSRLFCPLSTRLGSSMSRIHVHLGPSHSPGYTTCLAPTLSRRRIGYESTEMSPVISPGGWGWSWRWWMSPRDDDSRLLATKSKVLFSAIVSSFPLTFPRHTHRPSVPGIPPFRVPTADNRCHSLVNAYNWLFSLCAARKGGWKRMPTALRHGNGNGLRIGLTVVDYVFPVTIEYWEGTIFFYLLT